VFGPTRRKTTTKTAGHPRERAEVTRAGRKEIQERTGAKTKGRGKSEEG